MAGELITSAANAAMHAAPATGRTLTLADVGVLDQLVAHLPAARQLAIGRSLLEDERVVSSPIMRGPLAAIQSGLAPVATPEVKAGTLLANVRSSLAQEIGRIDGTIATAGLAGHPDYGVIGSIRSNLRLLEALRVI